MQKLKEPPQILDGLISEEVYKKSRTYALDNNTFGHFQDIYSNVLNSVSEKILIRFRKLI